MLRSRMMRERDKRGGLGESDVPGRGSAHVQQARDERPMN